MKILFDCLPCFLRQTLKAVRMVSDNAALHERVLRQVLRAMSEMNFGGSPALMGRRIHRFIREAVGDRDPYRAIKKASNQFALRLVAQLRERIERSTDPFATAVRLAIVGNVLDFGVFHDASFEDMARRVEEEITLAQNGVLEIDRLREAVNRAAEILLIGDNAGEIVFDRLLIEQIPVERVTYAVRGQPIINDATREDAEATGLADLVPIIDNGADAPGTILELCSASFRARFEEADLVIAKGQGNYETLNDCGREVFFLLKAKCPIVTHDLGCEAGAAVVRRSPVSAACGSESVYH